jgi:hypothetical protein
LANQDEQDIGFPKLSAPARRALARRVHAPWGVGAGPRIRDRENCTAWGRPGSQPCGAPSMSADSRSTSSAGGVSLWRLAILITMDRGPADAGAYVGVIRYNNAMTPIPMPIWSAASSTTDVDGVTAPDPRKRPVSHSQVTRSMVLGTSSAEGILPPSLRLAPKGTSASARPQPPSAPQRHVCVEVATAQCAASFGTRSRTVGSLEPASCEMDHVN